MLYNKFPLAMDEKDISKRYLAMAQCISLKNAIKIEYLSLKNKLSNRILHPYKLYMYNNAWFILGFDENSQEIRYFKLNRIQKFDIIDKKFRILLSYNERDYIDEYGMKQNGEWHEIKLKLTGPYAMLVRERIYGKDQQLECIDEKTSIISCKIQNKENIQQFVLGFGDKCEIIFPDWLKEVVKQTCKNILQTIGIES